MNSDSVTSTPLVWEFPTSTEDKTACANNFEVGDLVYFRLNKGFDRIDTTICFSQKLARKVFGSSIAKKDVNLVHVGIVTESKDGRVLLAEAVSKKGTRIIDLFAQSSISLAKPENKHYEFCVFKPIGTQNKALSQKAAAYAEAIAKRENYLDPKKDATVLKPAASTLESASSATSDSQSKGVRHSYSYLPAIKAIFSKGSKFGKGAKNRVFRQIYDTEQHLDFASRKGQKAVAFSCSYFIGHILQKSKASELADLCAKPDGMRFSAWKKNISPEQKRTLAEKLEAYAFDPKNMLPSELCQYLIEKNIYAAAGTMVPPKK